MYAKIDKICKMGFSTIGLTSCSIYAVSPSKAKAKDIFNKKALPYTIKVVCMVSALIIHGSPPSICSVNGQLVQ